MNRKELFVKVRNLRLQEKIKKRYGIDYTKVSNVKLEAIISECTTKNQSKSKRCKCDKLIEILKKKHILLDSEVDYINS